MLQSFELEDINFSFDSLFVSNESLASSSLSLLQAAIGLGKVLLEEDNLEKSIKQ